MEEQQGLAPPLVHEVDPRAVEVEETMLDREEIGRHGEGNGHETIAVRRPERRSETKPSVVRSIPRPTIPVSLT